jgi:glycerol kinase
MTSNIWLCQFLADILQLPVERPRNLETTALGAAFLAGLATGVWPNLDAVGATWQRKDYFEPAMSAERRQDLLAGWRKAIARTLSA